ncbi:MAG: thermonuclease family protein [Candidatus Gastranaerophilales bacterium]|nr:thermonuclease family protein [Candidatus Gastranaerophilales bacterium]
MKEILLVICILFLSPVFASKIPIKIDKVYDGDTIRVKLDSGNKFDIRFYKIDCYETSKIHRAYYQAYCDKITIEEVLKRGKRAKNYLVNALDADKPIYFEFKGVDKYNRVLGVLFLGDINLNNQMTNTGLCKPYNYIERD